MQQGVKILTDYVIKWQMKFSVDQCKLAHVGKQTKLHAMTDSNQLLPQRAGSCDLLKMVT